VNEKQRLGYYSSIFSSPLSVWDSKAEFNLFLLKIKPINLIFEV